MAEGADIIAGAVLVDDIVYADGSRREAIPGGAGLYALAGAALFSDDVVLVTGTGRDLPQTFGPWMERNRLTMRGLRFADDHAPRNVLRYVDERTRTETPVFGAEHFRRSEPTAADIAAVIGGSRSLFVFRNLDLGFWRDTLPLMARHRPRVLWEIALDACRPQNRPRIEELAQSVDAFSLNLEEAAMIYETDDESRLLHTLRAVGLPLVLLRAGARGSFVVSADGIRFVPSLPATPVDVTGGGNAFGGGALVGLAEGRPPAACAALGTVAARLAIAQYGPPEPGDPALRATARLLVDDLMARLEEPA